MMRLDISRRRISGVAWIVTLGLLAAACGSTTGSPSGTGQTPEPGALRVVATTTVFADLVQAVGGTNVAVTSIVPKGGEVHTFDPTPSDVARLADAELIVMNGLGLDDWLLDLIEGAGSDAPVVRLAEDLPGVEYIAGDHPDEPVNPHLWLDVANAQEYVTRIGDALAAADASRQMAYLAGAVAYGDVLATLDAEVRAAVDAIPATDREVVSFHEAFPYYAAAYGLTVVDTIVDAPGQDPSAGEIADLVAAIEASGVRAILSEAQFSDALVRTIADETGAAVVDDLYTDSLGDPPVDTYEGLIRWDTDRIVEALG